MRSIFPHFQWTLRSRSYEVGTIKYFKIYDSLLRDETIRLKCLEQVALLSAKPDPWRITLSIRLRGPLGHNCGVFLILIAFRALAFPRSKSLYPLYVLPYNYQVLVVREKDYPAFTKVTAGKEKIMKNTKKENPLISVIMPVYNAGDFLVEAIDSILKQTYKNFEFIIVDDASTDHSLETIKYYAKKDKRIKIVKNNENLGLSNSLIEALQKAKGTYIARMDADDIAIFYRFKKQVEYLKNNPDVIAIGSQCRIIDKSGNIIGKKLFPLSNKEIYDYAFRFNPVQHPSLMLNKSKLPKDFVYYDSSLEGAEDLDLIFRLFKYGKVENINAFLLKYRIHGNNMSLRNVKSIFLQAFLSRIKAIFQHQYIPNLVGLLTTIIEVIIVLMLPSKFIVKLYNHIRKMPSYKKSLKRKFVSVSLKLQTALQ